MTHQLINSLPANLALGTDTMIKLPEPVAHIYPSTLSDFETAEMVGKCFSIAVGCPDEVSVPLYTEAQLKHAIKDALEDAAKVAWNHYMDTCKKNRLPAAEFGYWMACDDIRKLKEQLK